MTPVRQAETLAFLAGAGWAEATRQHLAGDASARRYERLRRGTETAVLMDAPPGCGDDAADFLRIGAHLAALGLSPPRSLAADVPAGLVLLEDLGDALFGSVVAENPQAERPLYELAAGVLLRLHESPAPAGLPDLTAAEWAASALFAVDWYARAITGSAPAGAGLAGALQSALAAHADGPRVLILRDYHAGNLLWLPDRAGLRRVGLLDYQLAQMGQPEYDLVSLLQDARRDVRPETEAAIMDWFARAGGKSDPAFRAAYAALGALRALRILGIFARLCLVAGKDQYLVFLPRVWDQLLRNLSHPALAVLRTECLAILPAPTDANIERIRSGCGSEAFP